MWNVQTYHQLCRDNEPKGVGKYRSVLYRLARHTVISVEGIPPKIVTIGDIVHVHCNKNAPNTRHVPLPVSPCVQVRVTLFLKERVHVKSSGRFVLLPRHSEVLLWRNGEVLVRSWGEHGVLQSAPLLKLGRLSRGRAIGYSSVSLPSFELVGFCVGFSTPLYHEWW